MIPFTNLMCSLVPAGTRVDIWQDVGVVDAMAVIELEANYYVNLISYGYNHLDS
jgi:hypothetical protein